MVRMGAIQKRIVLRTHTSRYGYVMPKDWNEKRSCKRLETRGILIAVPAMPCVWRNNDGD